MVSARFPNRPFDLREAFWVIRQDIGGNQSLVGWQLWIDKVSYSPTFNGAQTYQRMSIDGNIVNQANWNGYDFTGNGPWLILSGENWVGHNSDGTKTFSINGYADFPTLGAVNVYSNFTLPTIPRTSNASFPNGDRFNTGTDVVINTNRYSTGFRHEIDWYFGTASGRALTLSESQASGTWSVPPDLNFQIPNNTEGTGHIRQHTFSGNTLIGYTQTPFTAVVPPSIGPTITGAVSVSEATSGIASAVGRYVQNISKLNVAVGAASSQWGATIPSATGYRVDLINGSSTVASIPASSGTTPILTKSGTYTVRGVVVDTRGRQATKSTTVSVLPYGAPVISDYSVARYRKSGNSLVSDPEGGEYVRVTLNTSVSSLVNSTERNSLTMTVQSRKRGNTTWTSYRSPTSSTISYNNNFFIERTLTVTNRVRSGTTATITTSGSHTLSTGDLVTISGVNNSVFNGTFTVTGTPSSTTFTFSTSSSGTVSSATSSGTVATPIKYPPTEAYDVRVTSTDIFSSIAAQTTVPVGNMFMHWSTGLGLGKFWEKGKLDVAGLIYSDGYPVTVGPVTALLDPSYLGPGPAKVSFDGGATLSSTAYEWIGKYDRWGNPTVEMVRVDNVWRILRHTNSSGYGGKISLKPYLRSNYASYNETTSGPSEFNEPRAQRLASGIVVLSGLLSIKGAAGSQSSILDLPSGYRPDNRMIFQVENSSTSKAINIEPTGLVTWQGGSTSGSSSDFVSLDGIAFPAAGVASWTNITEWVNGWGMYASNAEHTPQYWKDPYGVVWLRGLVGNGTKGTDAVMFKVPATHAPPLQTHSPVALSTGFGYVSAFPATAPNGGDRGVTWKSGNSSSATWLSLSGLRIVTADAYNFPWIRTLRTTNGWSNSYSANFQSIGVSQRPDGLAIMEGMAGAGTVEARITNLQDWIAPEKTSIQRVVAGDTSGRIDVQGIIKGVDRGSLWAIGPHNAWTAFDGIVWMVGD